MFWACCFMYWTGKLMKNLLSYCGLVDARISASEKDLPVNPGISFFQKRNNLSFLDDAEKCQNSLLEFKQFEIGLSQNK